jgi:hypothetical protein
MKIYRVTRLIRPFDLSQTSNRILIFGIAASGVASVAWDLVGGDSPDVVDALWVAAASYLSWAIARELDPDRPGTATLAMTLGGVAVILGPWETSLVMSAAALLGLRVLSGTVGGDLKPFDLVVFVGLAVFAGMRIEGWVVVLLLVLGVLDSRPRGYELAIPAMLIGAVAAGYIMDAGLPDNPMADEVPLWGLIAITAIPLSVRAVRIRTRTDIFDHPIRWPNVRAARVMAGFVVIGGLLASDADSVVLLSPVLAGLVATALVRTFRPA